MSANKVMTAVSDAEIDTAVAVVVNQLDVTGYSIAQNLVSGSTIIALDTELDTDFAETPFCDGDFYGPQTKRFGSLLVRSDIAAALVQHPIILGIANQILGPWTDTLQLNLTQAIEIHPGALAQFPHRDQDMWRGVTGSVEYLLNVIWPLTEFTAENGATMVWPRSHGMAALDVACDYGAPVIAECGPGDAIVFLGSTLHGAGANISAMPRRGVIISYCLGWLKPYENQWLTYPPAIARQFSPELAALVGYQQHKPNLGNYEGQCPSILLSGDVPVRIAATDALKLDQSAQLAAHVATQRASVATDERRR